MDSFWVGAMVWAANHFGGVNKMVDRLRRYY